MLRGARAPLPFRHAEALPKVLVLGGSCRALLRTGSSVHSESRQECVAGALDDVCSVAKDRGRFGRSLCCAARPRGFPSDRNSSRRYQPQLDSQSSDLDGDNRPPSSGESTCPVSIIRSPCMRIRIKIKRSGSPFRL